MSPVSIAALLITLVLLFAFQGEAILKQPAVIAMLAVPILIQVFSTQHWRTDSIELLGEQHYVASHRH